MEIRKANIQSAFDKARAKNSALLDRILENSNVIQGECWIWKLSPNRYGYGVLKIGGINHYAHRISHDLFHPQAGNNLVRHICNNPICVNPAHLRAGTPLDNAADRVSSGRGAFLKGVSNGRAKLSEAEVKEIQTSYLSGAELGRKFGVSKAMACRIKRGHAWSHI